MADVEKDVVIKVKAVDEASAPIKGLEEQLNDVKQQMLALAQAGKQNTAEFNKLAQEAGGLKAKIEGVEKSVDGFMKTQSRVELFGSAVAGIAAGFAVAQGAAALFGEENEDLQKSIMKLQGAMALLAGVQQLVELTRTENIIGVQLAAAAQRVLSGSIMTTVASLGAFRTALIATGVGAAVVAIGALVMHFNSLADAEEEAKIATDNYNKSLENQKILTDKVNANLDLRRQLFLAQGGDAVVQAERDIIQANKDLAESLKQVGKEQDLRQKLLNAGWKETDSQIQSLDIRLQTAENNALKSQIKIVEANKVITNAYESAQKASKKTTTDNTKNNEEDLKAFKQHVQDVNALIFETERNRLSANERELEEIDASYEAKFALVKDNETATNLLLSQLRAERIAKMQEQQDAADNAVQAAMQQLFDWQVGMDDAYADEKKKKKEQELADEKAFNDARVSMYSIAAGSIVEIMRSLGGKSKGVMLAALALEKGAAIAQVIINLQKEIAGIKANAALNPANAVTAGAAGLAQAASLISMAKIGAAFRIATIAATGISQGKSIAGGGDSGGGGGGGLNVPSGMAAPQGNALNPNSQLLNPNTGQAVNPQPLRAYVVESDVSGIQNRLRTIKQFAQLGN